MTVEKSTWDRLNALEGWRSRLVAQFVVTVDCDGGHPVSRCCWCGQGGGEPATVDHSPGCLLSIHPRVKGD